MPDPGRSARHSRDSADPVRWARAHDIFNAALERPVEERGPFVDAACGDDEGLRDEVSSLLASDLQAGDFIERPAVSMLAGAEGWTFTPRFAPGNAVGRYEILAFLGAGGIGEVYRARDTRLGRQVALKLVTDPDDRQAGPRLLAEAQHASILSHPNICDVYEVEDGSDLPFIVLELVEGPTLHDVLKERRPSIAEAAQWAKEIAGALDHAHRRGIIHRDLKSANVALSPDGTVKVLDFGLSRRFATPDGTLANAAAILADASVAGTLTHIAPEVLRGEPPDARIDLWALGVMLYEMTSGELPFKKATALQTVEAILEAPPQALPATVPAELQRLIARCLEKDPSSRIGTAAELRAGLEALRLDDAGTPVRTGIGRRPRVAVALALAALVGSLYGGWLLLSPPSVPVLAVLPLENVREDATEPFFANGVTEALIAELGRIDGIRVIAPDTSIRTSTAAGAGRDMAHKAGADHVLEGSVERTADRIRLSARLVEAASGREIWSQEYQRDAREIQALQATVAKAVAQAVDIEITADDARRFAAVRAVAPDVYEAYLKGRYYWNQRTRASIRTAIGHFEAALALDPTYAPAYAALADCYNQLGTVMVGGGPPREWRPKAAEAAIKALQIDADLAEAHATLGYVRHYDWEWAEAESSFKRAIALNPSYALARIWYANYLCSRLRFDEAVREVMIARSLDPLSLIVSTNVGWVLQMARRNDEAIVELERALALDPTYLQAHMRLAASYIHAGRFDAAIEENQAIARLSNGSAASLVGLEHTKMLAGRPHEFERRFSELLAGLPEAYVSPGALANTYFGAGRIDEGFIWLDRAYRERTNNIAYLAAEPVYDRVREDPRFKALLRAIGLLRGPGGP
jgi:TolB-like protein/Tfp pilus assembly protein PilF